jgi:hypothetical protein
MCHLLILQCHSFNTLLIQLVNVGVGMASLACIAKVPLDVAAYLPCSIDPNAGIVACNMG